MTENIDGDVEIVEGFIKNFNDVQEKYKDDEIQAEIERSCYFEEVPAKAIENLLSELERLKNENSTLIEQNAMMSKRHFKDSEKLKELETYKHLYEKLSKDFEDYKNDKDINYLDGIHHEKLVEKSIG